MRGFFSPAIAAMNRLGYNRKFTLLALASVAAFAVVVADLYVTLNDEIRVAQRELEGIALVDPISRAVREIQRHRGRWSITLSGSDAMQDGYAAIEIEAATAFAEIEGKLPPSLKERKDWLRIKADWERLEREEAGMTAEDSFAAHSHLIKQLLFFKIVAANEYLMTLDPQIDTYYLIDTAIIKLPDVLEYLGQLRAYGAGALARGRITGEEKVQMYKILGGLEGALPHLTINLEKTGRYNPAIGSLLSAISTDITVAVREVVAATTSEILNERFAMGPADFFGLTTSAIDQSYAQLHQSLLPMTESLLKARIVRAEKTLRASIGISGLLLLVVTYFAIGIYYSIIGSVRSLARSAHAFSEGDMSKRVHLDTRDEIGRIGDSFNKMAESFSAMLEARKLTQLELQHNQDLLNEAQRLGKLGSWELNLVRGELRWSDEIYRIFGFDPKVFQPSYENFLNVIHPDDRDKVNQAYSQSLQDRQPYDVEHRLLLADGCIKWVREHCTSEFDASGKPLRSVGAVQDITERKQAEENLRKSNEELAAINRKLEEAQNQLLQSEKMASIGQLAAGVAHEINNPIGYVYSNLGTLEKYVQDTFNMIDLYEQAEEAIGDAGVRAGLKAAKDKLDLAFLKEDLRALMDESKDGITRVKKIVQNLKDFSHVDAADEWHFVDLHKGLDSTLNIVNNEIKYKANVVREYGDIPEIECMSSQPNQVFMNLLVNAAHAIEERGTITIRTGQRGEEVWVEIADTGKGIAPEHLKKIFDPFFTTKPIGKGTGLGLSLSYGIIQKHHGRIEVQSEIDKGTTFRVWLPVKQPQEET